MITNTSREAYREHVLDGGARTQRERIMALFDQYGISLNRRQISKLSKIPINAVTGRVRALIDSGYLTVAYKDKDTITGQRVEFLRPVPREPKQGKLWKEK